MTAADPVRWAGGRPGTGLRLFCFPHAGSGPAPFMAWGSQLGPEVDVAGICLPGREHRITEPGVRRMDPLIAALTDELAPHLRPPYAFFGHSLGALVAFALCHRLEQLGQGPVHLFVSGSPAPHVRRPEPPAQLDDAALQARAIALDGLPPEVLAHPDLVRLVLPALRDDFELADHYQVAPTTTVRAPLTAMGGAHDRSVPVAALRPWRDLTTGPYGVIELPGGHFYLTEHERHVVRVVRGRLAAVLGPAVEHRPTEEVTR
jgi:surfactin synthase thioesterase subunit